MIRNIRIGYVVSSLMLVLIGVATYRSTVGFQEVLARRQHSRLVVIPLENILRVALDAETSARGYALTGSEAFLELYRSALGTANRQMDDLRTPLRAYPSQRTRLDRLRSLIDQWLAASQQLIEIRRAKGLAAAAQQVGTSDDNHVTGAIRELVAEIEGEERLLLSEAEGTATSRATATKVIVVLASGITLLILGLGRRAISRAERRNRIAEEALGVERARLTTLLQEKLSLAQRAGRVGVFDWDLATGRTVWTRELEEIFGLGEGEGNADGWTKQVHPEDLPRMEALLAEWLSSARNEASWECRIFLPGGQLRWIDARARMVRDPDGKPLRVMGTNLDVTERKRAMEAEVIRLADMVESSNDAIICKTPEGIITSWNRAAERIYGFTKEEALGHSVEMLIPPDRHNELQRILDHIRQGEHVKNFETTRLRKDGQCVVLSLTISPIRDGRGVNVGASTIARDITESKAAEAEIQRLNDDLRKNASNLAASNQELEAFSYTVSHDLRAPLRYLGGFLDLLKNHLGDSLDEKGRHYLDVLTDSAAQMGTLMDDLLQFARMGRVEISETKVGLADMVKGVQRELAAHLTQRKIVWAVEPLPEVAGDLAMLRQVLVNLLGNAIKYTCTRAEAAIEIGCREEGGEWVVFVRDNGVGFDMRYAHKLFGVFQRLHSSNEFEGTGIGLAIVHRVIARHGGRTWAEGVVGQGATFYFSLPRTAAEERVTRARAG